MSDLISQYIPTQYGMIINYYFIDKSEVFRRYCLHKEFQVSQLLLFNPVLQILEVFWFWPSQVLRKVGLDLLLGFEKPVHQEENYHSDQTFSQFTTQSTVAFGFAQTLSAYLEHLG